MGEALFGISGKGFCVLAADCHTAYGITALKDNEDKIFHMDSHKMYACAGPSSDRNQFMEYTQKNFKLYELRNQVKMNTRAAANWTRNELAQALRKGPYQTDILIGGYDPETDEASLYFMDYMASCQKLSKAAHGYGAYFCLGLMDRYWHPDMSLEDALGLIKKCIEELHERFILKLNNYKIKVVDKNGIREVPFASIK